MLIGFFFFSTHSETKSSDAAGEQQMLADVSSSFDEVRDEKSRSNSCFGKAKKARVWGIATAVSFFFVVFIFFDLTRSRAVHAVWELLLKFKVPVADL